MRGSSLVKRALVGFAALAVSLPVAAAALSGSGVAAAAPAPNPPPPPFRIVEFNIEYGGTGVDFGKVIEAIQASGASVAAIEEAYGHTARIARRLAWPYYDPRHQVVSQYPLFTPPDGDPAYIYIDTGFNGVVALANEHLPSSPYAPTQILRKGVTRKQVLVMENKARVPAINSVIDAVSGSSSSPVQLGIPTFIAGDFNSPSNLDWTSAMIGVRPQIKYAVDWPVTKALEQAGFVDSYRAIHPDPATVPGLTWPAARPKIPGEWNPPADSPQDRIDYIFSSAGATALGSFTVGEVGGPDVGATVDPWPSDHRAVVSTFQLSPVTAPALVSPDGLLVTAGDPLTVNYRTDTTPAASVRVSAGAGGVQMPVVSGQENAGSLTFDATGWTPGPYTIELLDGADAVLADAPVWVRDPNTGPEVGTKRAVYRSGQPIKVWWKNAPANRWDWIGIYHRGKNPHHAWYLDWAYTEATVEGDVTLSRGSHGPWPLAPGRYSVYLLVDDSYRKIAAANFTVR